MDRQTLIGQKGRVCHIWWKRGERPLGLCDKRFTFAYIFAAVEPGTDNAFALMMPYAEPPLVSHEISRFPHKERPHMPGSPTALGLTGARDSAPVRIAFRQENGVGAQNKADFAAQWLAYAIPCRRFAGILANACARLGADVVCYSFIAVDFHHLLLAGLPAHSLHGLLGGFRPGNASKCWGSRETLLRIHATSR